MWAGQHRASSTAGCGRRLRNRLCAPVGRLSGKVCGFGGARPQEKSWASLSLVERNIVKVGTDPGLSLALLLVRWRAGCVADRWRRAGAEPP